ncbi:MAG: hypothetical protein EXS36_01255 [Pedosphaera sp.]|nr:hypothetical protein [Pedosphaera sp.]
MKADYGAFLSRITTNAMSAPAQIIELRRILAERFPRAQARPVAPLPAVQPTGVPALDELLGGGLPRGEFTELVGAGHGSGSAQVIHSLLRETAAQGRYLALVDGADSFDCTAVAPVILSRLLWVRCRQADEALKAVDLLLRDPNFPLVVLDLKLNPVTELRRIQGTVWFRLARLREQHRSTLLLVSPYPLGSGVNHRIQIDARLGLEALRNTPEQLRNGLHFELLRAAPGVEDVRRLAATA